MATATETSKSLTLIYSDKGRYSFNKINLAASDQQLYTLAGALNAFQADPAVKVIKNVTKLIS